MDTKQRAELVRAIRAESKTRDPASALSAFRPDTTEGRARYHPFPNRRKRPGAWYQDNARARRAAIRSGDITPDAFDIRSNGKRPRQF